MLDETFLIVVHLTYFKDHLEFIVLSFSHGADRCTNVLGLVIQVLYLLIHPFLLICHTIELVVI